MIDVDFSIDIKINQEAEVGEMVGIEGVTGIINRDIKIIFIFNIFNNKYK
jgi:hypothetical protein